MKKRIQFPLILVITLISVSAISAFGDKSPESPIVTGVVPHHMLAKEIIENFFIFIASQQQHPETIMLFSPDHFNCSTLKDDNSFISIDWEKGSAELAGIPIDIELLKKLKINNNILLDRSVVLAEFGITNLLPFIKKYLPGTKIIPVVVPGNTSREQLNQLTSTINMFAHTTNILLVASVDFSHYLPAEAAVLHDLKSIRVLLNFEEDIFENIEVDSWQSLYVARLFAKLRESETPINVVYNNSVDFLPYDLDSTTSYFSVIFQKGSWEESNQVETILLAGDLMLGRGIKKLIKEKSIYHPFQNIVQLLRGVDIVLANLEGSVTENSRNFTDNEWEFSFHPNVLEAVKWSRFNLFSLANNHTADLGKDGLEETKKWLQEYQIHFISSPLLPSSETNYHLFYGKKSVFLAFNRIYPFIDFREKIIKEVQKTRQSNPEKVIFVSMHWGNEYELNSSSEQRELAHQIISAGADIIVGHHPHVVQEIELIQGKPVFYSLGNFIFDQQFLPETSEGLLIGTVVEKDQLTFRLFPIKKIDGQPMLMNKKEAEIFLENLAQRSSMRLWKSIKKGIIELELVR